MKTNSIFRKVSLVVCFFMLTNLSWSQTENSDYKSENSDFKSALGLRAGPTTGITYKHKFNQKNAAEFIFGCFPYALSATGLYERYMPTDLKGFSVFMGGGGHVKGGYYSSYRYYYDYETGMYRYYRINYSGPAIGVDGIVGVEYKIPKVPIVVSAELKPYLEFYDSYHNELNADPALGVKIIFK